MAKDLVENFRVAREAFEEASDGAHLDLKKLCFDGPDSDLNLTENTQPCLLTASVAAFRAAERELDFKPAAVAGHSLGEYSALVAAGALNLGVAAGWVRERGAAMQRAVPAGQGTMAAVLSLGDDLITELCVEATAVAKTKRNAGSEEDLTVEAIVEPANFNSPGQVVIAGSRDAVAEAVALIKAGGKYAGGKAIPLTVSAPFHCGLMLPARDHMASLFAKAIPQQLPKPLRCPYVPNRTARLTQELGLILELLVDQVDHPVLWKQSVETLIGQGFDRAVEFGPGKVLQGLAKRIAQPLGKTLTVQTLGDAANLRLLETALKGVKS